MLTRHIGNRMTPLEVWSISSVIVCMGLLTYGWMLFRK